MRSPCSRRRAGPKQESAVYGIRSPSSCKGRAIDRHIAQPFVLAPVAGMNHRPTPKSGWYAIRESGPVASIPDLIGARLLRQELNIHNGDAPAGHIRAQPAAPCHVHSEPSGWLAAVIGVLAIMSLSARLRAPRPDARTGVHRCRQWLDEMLRILGVSGAQCAMRHAVSRTRAALKSWCVLCCSAEQRYRSAATKDGAAQCPGAPPSIVNVHCGSR